MTTELICTPAEPLAAELAAIEQEAAAKTKALLDHQDTFRRAHDLARLLQEHGAPNDVIPAVVHHLSAEKPGFVFFVMNACVDGIESVMNALQDTRLPYHIKNGWNDDVRCINVEGYDGIDIAFPASFFLPNGVMAGSAKA